jgi:hypothetical protein
VEGAGNRGSAVAARTLLQTTSDMRTSLIALGAAALGVATMVACSSERAASKVEPTTKSAEAALTEATCNQAPWAGVGTSCATPSTVTGPITCDDLGLQKKGTNLSFGPSDFDTENQINFEYEPGFFTFAYVGTRRDDGGIGWVVSSMYDHEGETRTFDAVILSGATDAEASSVFVFDEPQFDVRDMFESSPTKRIQLCNYAPGKTKTLPPPPGPNILCGIPQADGTLGDPRGPGHGTLTSSLEDIRYELRLISPSAPDGTPVTLHAKLNGVPLADATPTLMDDRAVGTYSDPALAGATGELEIRMVYGGIECGIWYELALSRPDGGGGQTW